MNITQATNLSSLRSSFSEVQKKKDSMQAVLIQLSPVGEVTNHNSLRVLVTNLPSLRGEVSRLPSLRGLATNYPDNIELVSRLPNNIGLPDYIGLVKYCQSSIGGWDLMCVRLTYGVQHSNLVNNVHSVDCLALRCLRLISAFTAVTINCALLSPSSRFLSKSATTSCGKRAFSCCDLLLIELVAISESPYSWCDSVYAKINVIKGLKCDSLRGNFISVGAIHQIATPRSARNTIEAFNHNVKWSNTMAMYKSTQTHPKFKWRFFSCQQSKYFSVEASNEKEARSMLPDSPCLFSARIRQSSQNIVEVSA